MVNATIDNNPVSISLSNGESTTVPSGETWKVTIALSHGGGNNKFELGEVDINGNTAIAFTTEGDYSTGGGATPSVETVLTDGDTISVSSGSAHIGGFVVN